MGYNNLGLVDVMRRGSRGPLISKQFVYLSEIYIVLRRELFTHMSNLFSLEKACVSNFFIV